MENTPVFVASVCPLYIQVGDDARTHRHDEGFMVNFINTNIEICWLILSKMLIDIGLVHILVCTRTRFGSLP